MKPKAASEHEEGLLEYLEDIIGTSGYKEPIEQALAAMEAYNEERGEKVISSISSFPDLEFYRLSYRSRIAQSPSAC
jgi:chromosome segregation ATPase